MFATYLRADTVSTLTIANLNLGYLCNHT